MPKSRAILLVVSCVIPVALGAGALYWVLASEGVPDPRSEVRTPTPAAAPQAGSKVGEAINLARDRGATGTQRLIDSYRDWASDPSTVGARKMLLNTLFKEENVAVRLSSVLSAVEADHTPPEQDPLWQHVIEGLVETWKGDTATKGMDLMFAETRPRARRALISSFAALATSDRFQELTPNQAQKLTDYFIDMHKEIPAAQKPEVETALNKVAGKDVVSILNGKGLGDDDQMLDSEQAYANSLTDTKLARAPQGQGNGEEGEEE